MNPTIMALAMGDLGRLDGENKLVRLRDQLTDLGINAELRDSNSALLVRTPEPGLPVMVFVGYGGLYYSWQDANKRHRADDPKGAAMALADYIKSR
ncbi:hypothetical protein AB0B45_47580 [Nonomuraea sp. NPDC049152]|uniref:hypothetical protein n=1 Tax=Nonomuraea sp. NPDC049152 TaxID=3154350 RepID=UPI00341185B7